MNISSIGSPLISGAMQSLQAPNQSTQMDFAGALSKAAFETMNTIKAGEAASMDGLAGRAGVQDVV
ncbi:MAG: hypothetical protein ACRCT6_07650, partial [Notoacmeibacter sp.]